MTFGQHLGKSARPLMNQALHICASLVTKSIYANLKFGRRPSLTHPCFIWVFLLALCCQAPWSGSPIRHYDHESPSRCYCTRRVIAARLTGFALLLQQLKDQVGIPAAAAAVVPWGAPNNVAQSMCSDKFLSSGLLQHLLASPWQCCFFSARVGMQ